MIARAEGSSGDVTAGLSKIAWSRRSLPVSQKFLAQLADCTPCHIGLTQPLDAPLTSLGLWLLELGFDVSVLVKQIPQGAPDFAAVLKDAGAQFCPDRALFLSGKPDIILDTDGVVLSHATGPLRGGTIIVPSALPAGWDALVPLIDIGTSDLVDLCVRGHGIAQSCVSGFLDITNLQIAGAHVLVIGYDRLGSSVAGFAQAYGAKVTVCESNPNLAVRAKLDGMEVVSLDSAMSEVNVVFYASTQQRELDLSDLDQLPVGAFLCNCIDKRSVFPKDALDCLAPGKPVRDFVVQHHMPSGKSLKLICDGEPVHLASGQGVPLEYADIQLASQISAIAELLSPDCSLKNGVHALPFSLENAIAQAFLTADKAWALRRD